MSEHSSSGNVEVEVEDDQDPNLVPVGETPPESLEADQLTEKLMRAWELPEAGTFRFKNDHDHS